MFSIGDFARLANVSVRTLRYYEELGLLAPAAVDPATGYRSYRAAQLSRLHRIVALKDLGLSLQQLQPLLDDVSAEQLRGMLLLKRSELQDRLAEDEARLARVEQRLRYIEGEHEMLIDVVVKAVPELRVAAIRCEQAGLRFDNMAPAIVPNMGELVQRLDAAGVRRTGPLFIFHEEQADGTIIPSVAVDIGEQVLPLDDEVIREAVLPAIDVASTVVRGATGHDEIGPVYAQLWRWAEEHGYRPQGPGRDVIVGSGSTNPGDHVVELQLPVTKAST